MSGATLDFQFADGKEPDALRTIGEVAQALGIRQHVLRYWEEQFPSLKPVKRSGGRRYYRPEDVALIAEIDRLVHHQGYTLRGAGKAIEGFRSASARGSAGGVSPAGAGSPELIERLSAIRRSLAEALAAA